MYKELTQEKKSDLIRIMSEELPVLCVKAGLSQDEMANIIGISRQSFNLIELNKTKLIWRTCFALIMYFNLNPDICNLLRVLGLFPEEFNFDDIYN